jgi:hypothetical protein
MLDSRDGAPAMRPNTLEYSTRTATRSTFWIGFAAGLCLAAIANVLPYLLNRFDPVADGWECLGFPFTFRKEGGYAGLLIFSYLALAADLLIALAAAVTCGLIVRRLASR